MKISPSILSADFSNLEKSINKVNKAKYLHIDVMDGVFVPNISFGAKVQSDVKKAFPEMIIDTHLMIIDPIKYIKDFAKAKSDFITFHIESKSDIKKTIELIHSFNIKAGLSIKPSTGVDELLPYLKDIDMILVMSVEPGFGGQKFMDSAIEKIEKLNRYRKENDYKYIISVDGGINDETYKYVLDAKSDLAVVGSFLFRNDNANNWIEEVEKK